MSDRTEKILLSVLLIIASVMGLSTLGERNRLKSDLSNLEVRLAHAEIPFTPTVIRDTVTVVEQQVVEVEPRRMKEALAADRQLIRDLRLRISQLEALQTTTIATSDTVPAEVRTQDSCFSYSDHWTDIRLSLKDSVFYYNIRDSLATVISRQYRHRFLFLRWGTKGYEVRIVNFNPHARVIYNRYIKTK